MSGLLSFGVILLILALHPFLANVNSTDLSNEYGLDCVEFLRGGRMGWGKEKERKGR